MTDMVHLRAKATVLGEVVMVGIEVDAFAYDSSAELRDSVHEGLRQELVRMITKKWKPAIEVHR